MANENQTQPIEREFYYLDTSDLTYKRVLAQSREDISPNMWYVLSLRSSMMKGAQLFDTLLEVYKAAETTFESHERRFKSLKHNFKKLEDDVNF